MTLLTSAGDGVRAALARASRADETLRRMLRPHRRLAGGFAVLASGGHGRGDNTFRSDLDLILLLADGGDGHDDLIRRFIQALWDAGWSPAQTLVRLDEVDRGLLTIPDRTSALLEARLVWGDHRVVEALEARMARLFDVDAYAEFVRRKQEEFDQRRFKYGEVVRVVEPHLKAQAGGLRDLHHVFWIERARALFTGKWKMAKRRGGAILHFIGRLKRAGLLTVREAEELAGAYDLLLRLREALRLGTRQETDQLLVSRQPEVGRLLGLPGNDRAVMRAVMRSTYLAMEKVARFAEEFGDTIAEYGFRRGPQEQVSLFLPGATSIGGRLELPRESLAGIAAEPAVLLKLVDTCANAGLPLAGRTRHDLRRAIRGSAERLNDPMLWSVPLREWAARGVGFGVRLRRLHELDAITPWLPEWEEINGLTTGSYYHSYTVEEHTLRALERLDNLPGDGPDGLPRSLWENLSDRATVVLAVLFHDITKARRGDHSITGAHVAAAALRRLGWPELAGPVSSLVRLHLRMEQAAFRRDASDPAVVATFATEVGRESLLSALYLLTVCDLSAVSERVWTAWKGELLAELYQAAKRWFREGAEAGRITVAEEVSRVAPRLGGGGTAEERARRFLTAMREEYRRAVPAEEIAHHLEAAERVSGGTPFIW
ncbi:MAG TPA: HD domain-containing protein, partial [Bacteroidetes bacterium]|nr:HD domain-containing protein [Bacteroidota bacterium]